MESGKQRHKRIPNETQEEEAPTIQNYSKRIQDILILFHDVYDTTYLPGTIERGIPLEFRFRGRAWEVIPDENPLDIIFRTVFTRHKIKYSTVILARIALEYMENEYPEDFGQLWLRMMERKRIRRELQNIVADKMQYSFTSKEEQIKHEMTLEHVRVQLRVLQNKDKLIDWIMKDFEVSLEERKASFNKALKQLGG